MFDFRTEKLHKHYSASAFFQRKPFLRPLRMKIFDNAITLTNFLTGFFSWLVFALDDTSHTSLPCSSIGFVNVSKIYIINLGGRTPIFPIFFNMKNITFWALSKRNYELSMKSSPYHMVTWRMIFAKYLYESELWIATPLDVINFRPFYQTPLLWFLAHLHSSCSLSKIAVSHQVAFEGHNLNLILKLSRLPTTCAWELCLL